MGGAGRAAREGSREVQVLQAPFPEEAWKQGGSAVRARGERMWESKGEVERAKEGQTEENREEKEPDRR